MIPSVLKKRIMWDAVSEKPRYQGSGPQPLIFNLYLHVSTRLLKDSNGSSILERRENIRNWSIQVHRDNRS